MLSEADVLVLYFCITNYHKYSNVKQYPLISSNWLASVYRRWSSWSLCLEVHRWKSKCWTCWALIWRLWEEFITSPIHIVGRIQFSAHIGLKSSYMCWLLARSCFQQLEATLQLLRVLPSTFKVISSASNPSCALNLSDFLFSHQLEKTPCF